MQLKNKNEIESDRDLILIDLNLILMPQCEALLKLCNLTPWRL